MGKEEIPVGEAISTEATTGIPVIDLNRSDAEVIKQIRAACIRYGFFIITGHGIDEKLIKSMFALNKAFFALPKDEKMKIKADENVRGYSIAEDETLDENSAKPDTKEGIYISREMPADDPRPLMGPNQWPSEEALPGYRATTEGYIEAIIDLAHRLLKLLALSLDLDKEYFMPHFLQPKLAMFFLKPLHYFNTPSSEEQRIYGAGAHSDWGMLTLLKTSDVNGLQVKVDEKWVPVEPPADGYVINLGDMAARWTNDVYKSAPHRVMTDGRERYSIPFFFDPDFLTPIECLPTCQSPENPAKYEPVKSGPYVLGRYAETHESYIEKEKK